MSEIQGQDQFKIYIIFIALLIPHPGFAGSNADTPSYPEILGVMGVTPALENSCVAVWLAIPQGQALAGLEWFNNDGTLAFPSLHFESGTPENPVRLEQTLLAAENVAGDSGAWSSVLFDEPVTCASEGLYVVFRFPTGILVSGFGAGGGPAIGYVGNSEGAPGWLCSDGESWDRVGEEFGFAVLPHFVEASSGMAQLNGTHDPEQVMVASVPLVTTLAPPFPNPFNPEIHINYSVSSPQEVKLSIFDLRGHRIVDLANGFHATGRYSLTWQGNDNQGRRMSSGIYFVRFVAGTTIMNHRLVMVK